MKIKYVCSDCGSEDVLKDSYAAWDVASQEFELVTVFDQWYCNSCGGECSVNQVEIIEPKDPESLKDYADLVRSDAKEWIESGLKSFPNDKDMQDCHKFDAKNLKKLADLIESGNLAEARKFADRLDTVVREVINDNTWDMLHD